MHDLNIIIWIIWSIKYPIFRGWHWEIANIDGKYCQELFQKITNCYNPKGLVNEQLHHFDHNSSRDCPSLSKIDMHNLRHKLYLRIKNEVSKYLGAPFRAKMIFRKYDLRPLFNALKHYSMRSFFNNIFQISITSKLYCWKWNFCQGGKPRSKNDHLIITTQNIARSWSD